MTLTPSTSVTLPMILPNEWHTFRADLGGPVLTLMADGRVVWEGQVVEGLNDLKGPIGLRTDNVRVEFELYAGRPDGPREQADLRWYSCGSSVGE